MIGLQLKDVSLKIFQIIFESLVEFRKISNCFFIDSFYIIFLYKLSDIGLPIINRKGETL